MKSLADGLPPEIARQIHPDWRKNEADYWQVRDQVLEKHEGQWIAFADGAVIASDRRPMTVYQAAQESGKHPYVIRAGHEDEPCRMRRTSFAYDQTRISWATNAFLDATFSTAWTFCSAAPAAKSL